eukprot:scaffold3998_cov61-Phaeocystis_antarctica.AAC.7
MLGAQVGFLGGLDRLLRVGLPLRRLVGRLVGFVPCVGSLLRHLGRLGLLDERLLGHGGRLPLLGLDEVDEPRRRLVVGLHDVLPRQPHRLPCLLLGRLDQSGGPGLDALDLLLLVGCGGEGLVHPLPRNLGVPRLKRRRGHGRHDVGNLLPAANRRCGSRHHLLALQSRLHARRAMVSHLGRLGHCALIDRRRARLGRIRQLCHVGNLGLLRQDDLLVGLRRPRLRGLHDGSRLRMLGPCQRQLGGCRLLLGRVKSGRRCMRQGRRLGPVRHLRQLEGFRQVGLCRCCFHLRGEFAGLRRRQRSLDLTRGGGGRLRANHRRGKWLHVHGLRCDGLRAERLGDDRLGGKPLRNRGLERHVMKVLGVTRRS